jgi:haloalkane dehalogenase
MAEFEFSTQPLEKSYSTVNGARMAYHERGTGDTILFLHGNPTSSYLWRNILPGLAHLGRCIAPDLIGMGDSEKLSPSGPDRYRFVEQAEYLDGLLDQLNIGNRVILVIHDWGSALGFNWAARHQSRVRGIAYMEGIVRPIADWSEWSEAATPVFQGFRSANGEAMVLEKNVFIERVLPGSILRKLDPQEMAEYRRPFIEAGEGRRPTLTWPRQIPIAGDPPDVTAITYAYAAWMAANDLPKLFINAEPGAILIGPLREFCRTWHNQTEVTVKGSHFIQEDSPKEITEALVKWIGGLGLL